MSQAIDFTSERFAGKTAAEVLEIIKQDQQKAQAREQIVQLYDTMGIKPTRLGDKIMVKLDGAYPVTLTLAQWEAIQALLPSVLQAHKDLGIGGKTAA